MPGAGPGALRHCGYGVVLVTLCEPEAGATCAWGPAAAASASPLPPLLCPDGCSLQQSVLTRGEW